MDPAPVIDAPSVSSATDRVAASLTARAAPTPPLWTPATAGAGLADASSADTSFEVTFKAPPDRTIAAPLPRPARLRRSSRLVAIAPIGPAVGRPAPESAAAAKRLPASPPGAVALMAMLPALTACESSAALETLARSSASAVPEPPVTPSGTLTAEASAFTEAPARDWLVRFNPPAMVAACDEFIRAEVVAARSLIASAAAAGTTPSVVFSNGAYL